MFCCGGVLLSALMNADDEDVVALDGGWDYDEDEEDEVPEVLFCLTLISS